MTLFRQLTLVAAVTAGSIPLLLTAPAHAEAAKSISVSAADLNLASEEGRAVLQRRIKRAAEASCGHEPSPSLRLQRTYKDCVKVALDGAEQQVAALIDDATRAVALAQAAN
jgi:UrcA family protein